IGIVHDDGSGRETFAPDPATDYEEACFFTVASPGVESLYVAQQGTAGWQVRAYPLASIGPDPGRLVRQAVPGDAIHSLDAKQLALVTRPSVAFTESSTNLSQVLSTTDNGNGAVTASASGVGLRTEVRWAIPSDGVPWLTYVDPATQNIYRASRGGATAQRVYSDFFPESAGDLKAD